MTTARWIWHLVDLSAALAAGDETAEADAFERLENADQRGAVEELLLQSYLFLGFPVALEAFRRWRARGAPPPEPRPDDWDAWRARGGEVCREVYGTRYDRLRENMARLHPDLDRWAVVEGYGKVLGRDGLSLAAREMCIVAMLVVRGARRQLQAHLRGALNAGVSLDELGRVVERASRLAPSGNEKLASKLLSTVQARA